MILSVKWRGCLFYNGIVMKLMNKVYLILQFQSIYMVECRHFKSHICCLLKQSITWGRRCCEETNVLLYLAALCNHRELLIFAPLCPAVSFCSTWLSIRKSPCRILQRQPAFRLWSFSLSWWEMAFFSWCFQPKEELH